MFLTHVSVPLGSPPTHPPRTRVHLYTSHTQVIPITNLGMVQQLTAMLACTLTSTEEYTEVDTLERQYIFAVLWSCGAALRGMSRHRFDQFLRKVAEIQLPNGLLYDFFYDVEARNWIGWASQVPEYAPPSPFEFYKILVPTMDSVMYTWLLGKMSRVGNPTLFVGESGTAKTVTIQNYLNGLVRAAAVCVCGGGGSGGQRWRGCGGGACAWCVCGLFSTLRH
jgi:hypothetical protein